MGVIDSRDIAIGQQPQGKWARGAVDAWYQNGSPLANSRVGLWRLDEVSGNALPVVGASSLTANATPGSAAGITRSLARSLNGATQFFSLLDNATISIGNVDAYFHIWCKPTAVNVAACICGQWNVSGNRSWQFSQNLADVVFQVSPDGTSAGNAAVTATGALSVDYPTHIMGVHDAVNDLLLLYINGELAGTAIAPTLGIYDSLSALTVGRQGAASATYFGGLVQDFGLGKGYVPSAQEAFAIANHDIANGVRSVNLIGLGGEAAWSPDGERLVFDRRDGEGGNYQLYTIRPDGTGEVCITVPAVVGGPTATRHKGFPDWRGNYIVTQVEMETHDGDRALSEPGKGHQCDVWVTTPDGSQWWKLTNYSGDAGVAVNGVLNPRFNHAGTKLLWAKKIGATSLPTAPFGVWNLQLADFAIVEGVPTLSNITTLTPGSGTFYESHGFSQDDTLILYTSDAGLASPYGLDVFSCTLAGGSIVNISNSATQWDEHATALPHVASRVSFMSTRMYSTYVAADVPTIGLVELKSELVIANLNGTNPRQITHFNRAGSGEYDAEHSVASVNGWDPSGTRLVVAQNFVGTNLDTLNGRKLWVVDFNGIYA